MKTLGSEISAAAHTRRRLSCGLLGLILFLIYLRHGVMTRGFVDDAYIFLRYARNCLNGDWLAWNPGGGPTDGITSPLWLGLCCGAMKVADWLHREPEMLLKALMLGATIFWALCLYRAARAAWPGCSRLWPCLALGIIVVWDDCFDAAARTGMETMLASGLVALTILLLLRMQRLAERSAPGGRLRLAALWAGLAGFACVLTRPELALFAVGAPALMMLTHREARKSAAQALILVVALGAGFAAARYMIYGSLVPLPAYVKSGFGNIIYRDYDRESLLTLRGLPFEFLRHYVLLLAALAAILVSRSLRRATLWLWAPLVALIFYWFTTLQIMGYELRYYQPLVPMMTIMFFVAGRRLSKQGSRGQGAGGREQGAGDRGQGSGDRDEGLRDESRSTIHESPPTKAESRVSKFRRSVGRKERRYLLAAITVLLVVGYSWNFWRIYLWRQRHPQEAARVLFREDWPAIRIIRQLERFPGLKIAATEIGYTAFRNPRSTVFDLSGLNDKEFCHGFDANALFKRRPDVICLVHYAYKGMVSDIVNHPEFRVHFKPVFIPDSSAPEKVDITHRIYCDDRSQFYSEMKSAQ